jgi:hypothetical protein
LGRALAWTLLENLEPFGRRRASNAGEDIAKAWGAASGRGGGYDGSSLQGSRSRPDCSDAVERRRHAVGLVERARPEGQTLAASRRANRAGQGETAMTTYVLGIDIGVTGGIALLNEAGALIDVYVMPCLHDGPKNRRTINAPLLAEIAYKSHARTAFIERVGPRPQEGAVGAFAFGDSKGVIRGVLAAAAIPTVWISPPQWKRVVGIAPGSAGAKDAARAEAIRRWPSQAGRFALKNTDGLAESALIGLAGLLAFDLRVVHGPRDNSAETSASA